jgi:NAD-dependent DNA ligase
MNKPFLNDQGQPPTGFHFANNEIKAINTLYGIIMGMTADEIINEDEILFLDIWLKNNSEYTQNFPLNVIKKRVKEILSDGVITQDERENLYQVLLKIQGNNFQETGLAGGGSNHYIFEEPSFLSLKDALFCLTGEFVSGPRERCEQRIKKFGGLTSKTVNKKLDYLIVGMDGSRDWIAAGHGRKIEKAMHYKNQGCQIIIMSEECLLRFISI